MSVYYNTFILMMSLVIVLLTLLVEWSWVMEVSILNMGVLNISFSMFLEKFNTLFILTVLLIFSMVYLYSFSYLSGEIYLKRFLCILSLFAFSMCILILSGNLFSSLIGWDSLGVTSLFLILFYYSKSALKASTLTFLMNRMGDCFFILTLAQVLLLTGGQVLYTNPHLFSVEISLLLLATSITKSAQIPFSTWLPAAMEAPTPVSALVHSSTLVTAGIYLLYRYSVLWINSDLKIILMILSLSTCFMAAMAALIESDLKKLIALSTLSQLGFIMFSLSASLLTQGFLHMVMHAYFKALLFMAAGLVIHSFKGSQSIMSLSLSKTQNPLLMTIMSCSLMSMSGLPFLSGFYSKDLILDSIKETNWSVVILFLLVTSFLCTIMYSTRMVWYLLNSSSGFHSMSDDDWSMIKPMIPLALLSAFGGSVVSWITLSGSDVYVESSKVLVLISLGIASSLYWLEGQILSSSFLEKKWNLNLLNTIFSDLCFQGIKLYGKSSDLMGLPEVINTQVKGLIESSSKSVSLTILHYSGSYEFLVFLLLMIIIMM